MSGFRAVSQPLPFRSKNDGVDGFSTGIATCHIAVVIQERQMCQSCKEFRLVGTDIQDRALETTLTLLVPQGAKYSTIHRAHTL